MIKMHLDVGCSTLAILAIASPAFAFFRLPCASPIVIQRADPIVNPGTVSDHVHTIMGGNGFGFEMDFAATQRSTCSSCTVVEDKSNYWTPTLYFKGKDGKFTEVTQTGGATIYYLQRTDPKDAEYPNLHAFPDEFRMVAGNPMLRSYNKSSLAQQAVTWSCLGTNTPETGGLPNIVCPDGLRAQIFFPSCWNGKDLDAPDHKSHMAYPSGSSTGSCPPGFPRRLVSIFYEIIFNTPNFEWWSNQQPFVLSNGDPTGYGFHGDFVNGWKKGILQQAVDDCNMKSGVIEECKHFNFITNEVAQSCRVPPSIAEKTSGTINALPGCNPPQAGPANAKHVIGCGAPTTISKPQFPYVDMTASKRSAYIGCGLDPGGQPRTLQGANDDRKTMTIESCIDFCTKKGFQVAGLEYSTQCFCDNYANILKVRLPVTGLLRDCSMPCAGNPSQVCGGSGLISLYQKCSAGSCVNTPLTFLNGSHTASGQPLHPKAPYPSRSRLARQSKPNKLPNPQRKRGNG